MNTRRPGAEKQLGRLCEGHLNNHFTDLDGIKVNLIATATIEKFITAKQNHRMSLGTLRKVLVTLNQVMGYAVRHRYIDYNPVRDAERPKATDKIDIQADMQVLPPEQIKALLEAEPDQKYKTLFLMAVMTRMRQGELLGMSGQTSTSRRSRPMYNGLSIMAGFSPQRLRGQSERSTCHRYLS